MGLGFQGLGFRVNVPVLGSFKRLPLRSLQIPLRSPPRIVLRASFQDSADSFKDSCEGCF